MALAPAPAPDGVEPLRADAARNRERIVAAACALFAERGLEVPLEDVARRADVGIATLYRRFPARGDLVAAVLQTIAAAYLDVVNRACSDPDPSQGMRTLILGLGELQAANAALRELVVQRFPGTPEAEEMKAAVGSRIDELLARGRDAGQVRPDVTRADISLILLGNSEIISRTSPTCAQAWRRFAALQLEALRPRPDAAALPTPPSIEELHDALRPCQ